MILIMFNVLYLEEPLFVSSTERPTKKPDLTKKPVTPHKEKVNFKQKIYLMSVEFNQLLLLFRIQERKRRYPRIQFCQ
jgi:hypothetical protein